MSFSAKVFAATAGLIALTAGFVLGGLVNPFDKGGSSGDNPPTKMPGGLLVSQDGYTLHPVQTPTQPQVQTDLRFSVTGPDGVTLTDFTETHDKKLHLVIVRRDLAYYQHVHPTMESDGTWVFPVAVPAAGQYRMFTDFRPAGRDSAITLGADFAVSGDYTPTPLPATAATAIVDAYEVSISGDLAPGTTSKITMTVSKNGQPVTDLQPYLAAYGHLVVLREGDAAYLHVHPDGEPGDGKTQAGSTIVFYAEVPSAGNYRLYLDFQHNDVVRTAEFTAVADTGTRPEPTQKDNDNSENHNGDHGSN